MRGIYLMNERYTPGDGVVLSKYQLQEIPRLIVTSSMTTKEST
jgi:hypothetical protein